MNTERIVAEPKNRKITDKISSYTEYLKKEYGLAISIHFADKYNYVFYCEKNLLVYNVHINPYCFNMKSNRKNRQKCLRCQKLVLHHCGKCESFVGRCYAGVSEYICGIYSDGEPVGFISVSGYRDKNIPFGQNNLYDESMKDEEIPVQLLDPLVSPLGLMLRGLCRKHRSLTSGMMCIFGFLTISTNITPTFLWLSLPKGFASAGHI